MRDDANVVTVQEELDEQTNAEKRLKLQRYHVVSDGTDLPRPRHERPRKAIHIHPEYKSLKNRQDRTHGRKRNSALVELCLLEVDMLEVSHNFIGRDRCLVAGVSRAERVLEHLRHHKNIRMGDAAVPRFGYNYASVSC